MLVTSGFFSATEWRTVREDNEHGRATAWARLRYPHIAGEAISRTQHLIALADYANGLSWRFDFRSWQFIPPELTLHILRPPVGEWICPDALTELQAEGVGLTTARLFDQQGPVARCAQALFNRASHIARRLPHRSDSIEADLARERGAAHPLLTIGISPHHCIGKNSPSSKKRWLTL